jgi:hypothetical protein
MKDYDKSLEPSTHTLLPDIKSLYKQIIATLLQRQQILPLTV